MIDADRRQFLKLAGASAAFAASCIAPPSIRRALALPALGRRGTIHDVRHIVLLMQENRSFDHYFGTLRGVRGFGDRHPVPLASGLPVWQQSDGSRPVPPFHLDAETTSALRVASTPHTFADAQAAWNQGRFGHWPLIKTPLAMGHYQREDIPFQFALADAFTLCDAYHCSLTTGTDPNRVMFFSGSNHDPERRRRGENCDDRHAEVNNLRCEVRGALPSPGYIYQGNPFAWPTLPDLLQAAGISWRIYQDPNDNWSGLMHGGLAFESFRNARPGSPNYDQGMTHWSLERFAEDAARGTLPQVSWILPPRRWSEHPGGSSPPEGAEFTSRVLDALTANPRTWGQSALFVVFDENDGFFDHVPPPAPPSFLSGGGQAGKSTLPLEGLYFADPDQKYVHADDPYRSPLRPWGLGPRVPLYVVSPWSRGGWVNSQVFDHTSIGQFIEKRFGIVIPSVSRWHRAVCGDLTTAFDFAERNAGELPPLPKATRSAERIRAARAKPAPAPPSDPEPLHQEPGIRPSRALPYSLSIEDTIDHRGTTLTLAFRNTGGIGAVFHVYDRRHLDRIPRRYTVEAGRSLSDMWSLEEDAGAYDLWILAPNGFLRELGGVASPSRSALSATLAYDAHHRAVRLTVRNDASRPAVVAVQPNAYRNDGPWSFGIAPQARVVRSYPLRASSDWYDLSVSAEGFRRRFAGRMETGRHGWSDPA